MVNPAELAKEEVVVSKEMIANLLEVMKHEQLAITIADVEASAVSWLGSGGSKTVYDIVIGNEHFAFSLPNAIDDVATIMRKWQDVLNEPTATDHIRKMGFFTNSLSQIVQSTVNGVPFPGLLMRRYADLPFEIRDNKNPVSSTGTTRIIPPGTATKDIAALLKPIANDIRMLLGHNVHIGRDAINLCIANGQPRLFFNDLGTARFEVTPSDNPANTVRFYVDASVSAVTSGLTTQEYNEYGEYFELHRDALCEALYQDASSGEAPRL